ncbi:MULTISPECIES: FtsW/RodA/SpoVE family cell cycle protein [unclassified Planococcus (in: firmicutes)]|uniref:FtsW/RodA/SpoVE family cell cycle protein n=1 Tax=Planococcus TaxID=1372 RepID=UPI000C7DAED6|nr:MULTISPECIES: FtsW/RodA/SpoVE family cell cycle protein [unclassified Planococcus (in: firmicutes)]PKG48221.1 cell division protein FtsW [Planococcus sp. Urea-trap-24]PKG92069.1 cell division protein FtsW [Planococcus sp. Urea-3u-39]PKH43027.1 cell division protein FtsW [Planococcus sp. MB-3u-09]
MKSYIKKYGKYIDYPLLFAYLALTIFGLIMIYSSSMAWSVNYYNDSPDRFYIQQLVNLAIAYPVFLLAAVFPYKHFKKKWMMATVLAVIFAGLILVHFIGFAAGGAKSWISLGFANIQPSEVAKVGLIFYLAGVFSNKYRNGSINKLNESIIPPVIILTAVLLLVFLEPDLGSMVIIGAVGLSVMAASGVRLKPFVKLAGIVIAAAAVFIIPAMIFAKDLIFTEKRVGRIDAFFNPFSDELGFGFQIVNGYLAIGSGGLSGLGLGQSIQKLGYLPEPHTDFIMSVIAEELGVLGVFVVIGGLGFVVLRGLWIAMTTSDPLARMLAAGVASMIGIQSFVNLGGLSGIIPLTGVTLPFISYGGTSVILLSLAMGVLMNVSMFNKYEKTKK